ncbi:hypothetical protein [Clostridium tarantellae]|uniref:Uncharacterized protein n=1 Tax=Clostridium tarantellae TaxID=39493 RepID=A0A6I1MRR1_9CLOT|nr:hypothetical protein [Clostridium tarantellae]MPQ43581.1 hypothetical protein [Clostridium tarantellae]
MFTDMNQTDILNTGYVNIRNMGGFIAMFEVDYMLSGQQIKKTSNIITLFGSEKIEIPAEANNIYVKVSIASSADSWFTIYNNHLDNMGVIDLELTGTIWEPNYYAITETQKPAGTFKVINNGAFTIKYNIQYHLNGMLYSLDSENFYLGMTRSTMLPNRAQDISITIDMDSTGLGRWSTIYSESFKDTLNLIITLSGTVFAPAIDVQKQETENMDVPLNSVPVNGMPMNTNPPQPIQPVANNILKDGYVNIRNMGGFIAYFTLKYKLNGEFYNEDSNTIQLFGSEKIAIPRNANDIYVQVSVANMSGEWVPIYNNHLTQAGVIDLELTGTMWDPTYYVITETNSAAVAAFSVVNNGGFLTRFSIRYSVGEENFILKTGKFYLGMVRKIMLPSDATDINLTIEADAIGIGNWSEIYNETFSDILNLTVTLSGTIWSPGVYVDKQPLSGDENASPLNSMPPSMLPKNPVVKPVPTTPTKPAEVCQCANDVDNFFKNYMSFMEQMHNEFMNQMKKQR